MKLWTWAHQTPDDCRGTLHSPVFGGARSPQSHQCQPQQRTRRKHSDRSCPSRRPLSPRTLFLALSPWHSFHRIPVAWQPTTVWGLQGNWERRAEDRKDGMFCVFYLKLRCCVYSFLFLLFLSSSVVFILFFSPDHSTLMLHIIKGQGKNSCLPLFSHPNPFHPPPPNLSYNARSLLYIWSISTLSHTPSICL